MSKIYFRWIKEGRMTIDEVPSRWRHAVEKLLQEDKEVGPNGN